MDAVVLTWRPINILSIALMVAVLIGGFVVINATVKKVKSANNGS